MDANQLDAIARDFARGGTRRGVLRLLLGLPVLAGLLAHLDGGPASAQDDDHGSSHRRRRRRTRHKHRKNRVRRNKKHKKRKKHKPKPKCAPRTCSANGCGSLADGCGGTLQCGGCGTNQLCVDGTCRTCDVCQPEGACAFTSVQAAIDATDPQLETILVCPGTYVENAVSGYFAINIPRSLRLVGVGDGADPATNTILKPDHDAQIVVFIPPDAPGRPHVTLERVQITGVTGGDGYGLASLDAVVDLIGCTITGNTVNGPLFPGGIFADSTTLTLTDTRITGNTGGPAGGLLALDGSQVTFDTRSRLTGNTATGADYGGGFGGIRAEPGTSVVLPSVDNVTGNTSPGGNPNCGGGGTFVGDGVVCTTTT